ncbi:MAG: PEGA domain-containing protein, partial [Pedobacter sp.]
NEIMLATPHEPHKESPPIPKGLSKIIMKALEKEPGKRFQSGMELANALQQCLKEEQVVETPKPSSKNTMRFGISIAAALMAAIVAGGIYFFSRHKEPVSEKQQTRPALVKPASPPVKSAPQPVRPASVPVKPVPVIIAPSQAPKQTDMKKAETKPSEIPNKTGTKPIISLSPATAPKPLPKFAFLKVHSTPKGARVYINETLKGNAPVTLKLGLGEYRVRLSRPGYSDSENKIKIEKMTEYSLTVKLKLTK